MSERTEKILVLLTSLLISACALSILIAYQIKP